MTRKLFSFLAALAVLLCAAPARSQTRTIVSGTVTGTDGVPWTGATLTIIWNSPGGVETPSLTPCTNAGGCPFPSPSYPQVNLGTGGTIQPFGLWANASILPAGSSYTLMASINGNQQPLGTGPQVCVIAANVVVTGASQTISTSSCPAISNIVNTGGANAVQAGAQYSLPTYPNAGTNQVVGPSGNCTPPSTNGQFELEFIITGAAPTGPSCPQIGLPPTSLTGSTSSYTVTFADNAHLMTHDVAGSAAVTVTLPTATTLLNSSFVWTYCNHSAQTDTITPTTWTIQAGAHSAGSSLSVGSGVCYRITVDANSSTQWHADGSTSP